MTTILVTGASGNVGSSLVPLLADRGVTVRALVRNADQASALAAHGAQLAEGDFGDRSSLRAALDGVDSVFLACANVPEQVDHECGVIDEAARAGAQRIVKLSARGAAVGAPVAYWHWHGLIERHLHKSKVPAVELRPGFLMTNLLGAADQVREQAMLFAPAADARIAMIEPADVAAVAAVALVGDGRDGSSYVLTGPEAITFEAVAAELSTATGRTVGFVDVPGEAAAAAMVGAGLPAFAAEQVVSVFEQLRRGQQSTTTTTVQDLTGRPARPFAEFAGRYAAAFGREQLTSISR